MERRDIEIIMGIPFMQKKCSLNGNIGTANIFFNEDGTKNTSHLYRGLIKIHVGDIIAEFRYNKDKLVINVMRIVAIKMEQKKVELNSLYAYSDNKWISNLCEKE